MLYNNLFKVKRLYSVDIPKATREKIVGSSVHIYISSQWIGESSSLKIMNNIFTTSRSHYQSYLDSPRLFYVTYCAKGTGLAPKLVNPNLAIGTFVHEVCGSVMSGGSEADAIKHQTEIFKTQPKLEV